MISAEDDTRAHRLAASSIRDLKAPRRFVKVLNGYKNLIDKISREWLLNLVASPLVFKLETIVRKIARSKTKAHPRL